MQEISTKLLSDVLRSKRRKLEINYVWGTCSSIDSPHLQKNSVFLFIYFYVYLIFGSYVFFRLFLYFFGTRTPLCFIRFVYVRFIINRIFFALHGCTLLSLAEH
jgi:hypothetical protein